MHNVFTDLHLNFVMHSQMKELVIGQQATGNRQQGTGNRQQATGNRQQETGKAKRKNN
jgi:hypothetical protein